MTGPRTNGDIHTLAGAYALDALTEIERAAFARHVAGCEACALEVAELQETVSRLGGALSEPPPARLRGAVMAQVARTRQAPPGVLARSPERTVVQRWRRWTAGAVAAGVIAVGAAATTWVVLDQRLGDARRQTEQLAEQQARVNSVLSASDVALHSVAVPGGGTLTVAASASQNAGVVLMSELAAPPTDKVYQLWLLSDTAPVPVPALLAGQRSATEPVAPLGGADNIGVTLEPPGGSKQPSMTPIATVPIA
jgi:anti-sigma factor RsiW